ncbi:uncharacterized protein ColSpa_01605 [Colletotrichum spaethianum]|uniref:Uncharacterized protein n=1 Tax=Colletotrichum spaethianum TaxID=700344 RepID=A0AA37L6B5_9PEZI|nr:uncharacterized protein ColSpa_01605 [Colletotrichum spaethianum]GKT41424.1 hypothetical protein ColSpa_01605 [Colletotrichum spaethianum]
MSWPQQSQKNTTDLQAPMGDFSTQYEMADKRAEAHIQHQEDQGRHGLYMPSQGAETLIQQRAEYIRNRLEIPIDRQKFTGIWNHYHDVRSYPQSWMVAPTAHMVPSTHTTQPGVDFPSGPLSMGVQQHGQFTTSLCSNMIHDTRMPEFRTSLSETLAT